MAILSRPVLYGSLLVVAAVAFWTTGADAKKPAKRPPAKVSAKKSSLHAWVFPEEETSLHFPKPIRKSRDIFHPLIVTDEPGGGISPEEQIMKLPASLADGEADWAYTGMVEIDGKRLALLENGTRHLGGYVREGETWKKSRIVRIAMESIVLEGPDGTQQAVSRYRPELAPKPPPPPAGGFQPLDISPALKGPFGLELQKRPEMGSPVTKPAPGGVVKSDGVPIGKPPAQSVKSETDSISAQKDKTP